MENLLSGNGDQVVRGRKTSSKWASGGSLSVGCGEPVVRGWGVYMVRGWRTSGSEEAQNQS